MHEIDLIPASYRRERARKLWTKLLGGGGAALLVGTATARVWLDGAIGELRSEISRLETEQTITRQQRDQLASLTADRDSYQQRLYLLQGLRSGTAATNLIGVIDDSLVGDELWFRNWQFRRAGVTNAEGQPVESGYFVVVGDGNSKEEPWQVETHMTIAGQARDHAALSEFVRRLLEKPAIESARIRRTEQQRFDTRTIVDFDLAVVINRRVQD